MMWFLPWVLSQLFQRWHTPNQLCAGVPLVACTSWWFCLLKSVVTKKNNNPRELFQQQNNCDCHQICVEGGQSSVHKQPDAIIILADRISLRHFPHRKLFRCSGCKAKDTVSVASVSTVLNVKAHAECFSRHAQHARIDCGDTDL